MNGAEAQLRSFDQSGTDASDEDSRVSPETQLFLLEHGGPMVLLLLLGGSMGSFLNVVVDRGSRGVSIVRFEAANAPIVVCGFALAARTCPCWAGFFCEADAANVGFPFPFVIC